MPSCSRLIDAASKVAQRDHPNDHGDIYQPPCDDDFERQAHLSRTQIADFTAPCGLAAGVVHTAAALLHGASVEYLAGSMTDDGAAPHEALQENISTTA